MFLQCATGLLTIFCYGTLGFAISSPGDIFGLRRLQLDSPNLGFFNQWEQQKTPSANSIFCSSIGNCLLNDCYFETMHSDSVNNKKLPILVLNSPPEGHDVDIWNEGRQKHSDNDDSHYMSLPWSLLRWHSFGPFGPFGPQWRALPLEEWSHLSFIDCLNSWRRKMISSLMAICRSHYVEMHIFNTRFLYQSISCPLYVLTNQKKSRFITLDSLQSHTSEPSVQQPERSYTGPRAAAKNRRLKKDVVPVKPKVMMS